MYISLAERIKSLESGNETINARLEAIEQAVSTILQKLESDSEAGA